MFFTSAITSLHILNGIYIKMIFSFIIRVLKEVQQNGLAEKIQREVVLE